MRYEVDGRILNHLEDGVEVISDNLSEERYDNWLDEVYEEISIGSLSYLTSFVLKKVDPIAYRCGFSDFQDSLRDEIREALEELEAGERTKVFDSYVCVYLDEEE